MARPGPASTRSSECRHAGPLHQRSGPRGATRGSTTSSRFRKSRTSPLGSSVTRRLRPAHAADRGPLQASQNVAPETWVRRTALASIQRVGRPRPLRAAGEADLARFNAPLHPAPALPRSSRTRESIAGRLPSASTVGCGQARTSIPCRWRAARAGPGATDCGPLSACQRHSPARGGEERGSLAVVEGVHRGHGELPRERSGSGSRTEQQVAGAIPVPGQPPAPAAAQSRHRRVAARPRCDRCGRARRRRSCPTRRTDSGAPASRSSGWRGGMARRPQSVRTSGSSMTDQGTRRVRRRSASGLQDSGSANR